MAINDTATSAAPAWSRSLRDRRALWLTLPVVMALVPHALYVPIWVSIAAALGLLWRLSPFWRKDHRLQKMLRIALAGGAAAGIYLQFHTLFGPQAGIGLLVLMATLKLLESESRRDHAVMVMVGYFLAMSVLIHHQQIAAAAWLFLTAVALTAALAEAQTSAPIPVAATLGIAGGLVLQALPLAILLFLLFPRLPSPMAGLTHTGIGRTGLSDSMSPGSVSRLIRSDAIAFRVDFAEPGFDARSLYWRGPVLADFDGRAWRRAQGGGKPGQAELLGRPLAYTVTLEASGQPWLPMAGLVAEAPLASARVTADLEWLSTRPISSRLRYSARAWRDYRLEPELTPSRRAHALYLPNGANPEALALGRRWAAEADAPRAVVTRALDHFRREPFHYTLNPPLLGEHAVDDFLFRARRGFCEHYAGAFTVLMRAAGLPARVVTGYQGGERNPVGDYWIVRQRDAHAWAEVWLDGSGWVPVDPTAAVAPERIERGIDAALPMAERPLLNLPADWLRPLRQAWDFIDNGWNQWVLGYDFERQRRLLNSLSPSLANLRGMLWAMLAGLALLLGALALLLLRRTAARPKDEIGRLYARFLARLTRIGLARGPAEGPSDFADRAARDRPDLAGRIHAFSGLYVLLRYGGGAGAGSGIAELRRHLRSFKPGRRRDRVGSPGNRLD